MNRRLFIAAATAIAFIALTQVIAYASDQNSDENFGVVVVNEGFTENGYQVTLMPEDAVKNEKFDLYRCSAH